MRTIEDIREDIAYLEDDNVCLQQIMQASDTPKAERAECRMRLRANEDEISKLKTELKLAAASQAE